MEMFMLDNTYARMHMRASGNPEKIYLYIYRWKASLVIESVGLIASSLSH